MPPAATWPPVQRLRGAEAAVLERVVVAYADLLYDQQAAEVARVGIVRLDAQVAETRSRFKLGQTTRTDLAQLEAQRARVAANPLLLAQRRVVDTSVARIAQARAQRAPSVDLVAGYGRVVVIAGSDRRSFDSAATIGATVRLPLLNGKAIAGPSVRLAVEVRPKQCGEGGRRRQRRASISRLNAGSCHQGVPGLR